MITPRSVMSGAAFGMVILMAACVSRGAELYVRGDGLGSDTTHSGSGWTDAYATIQKALDQVAINTPMSIHVQESTGSQAYATCSRSWGGANPGDSVTILFIGGWMNVDGAPEPGGVSRVQHATGNAPGIRITAPTSYHNVAKNITVDRFVFTNVTDGINLSVPDAGSERSGISLVLSHTTIRAGNNGVLLSWPSHWRQSPCTIRAGNVDILAGLNGVGDGIRIAGSWDGSLVGAMPGTVSSIRSLNGCGLNFISPASLQPSATVSNTVIYGCSSHGVHLAASQDDAYNPTFSNRVRAVIAHCTIVDNAGDGLHVPCDQAGSYAAVTNCIFAGNGGAGVNLEGPAGVFTCPEGFNVLFNDEILTHALAQPPDASDRVADPLFAQKTTGPDAYMLKYTASPAYRSASDGSHRGAWQNQPGSKGTVVICQ